MGDHNDAMRSPASVVTALHYLALTRPNPRSVLLIAPSSQCSRELFNLLALLYPTAAHEVRVHTPAGEREFLIAGIAYEAPA